MAILRQLAAMCFAATLAWDYCARNDELLGFFSSWSLFLQFIYFQLPIKSRALCFVHSLAFICSITVPLGYLYSLLWNPLIELNHALEWEVSYSTVIIRSILVHFVPMFFHAIDITSNQDHLIGSYHLQPRRLMMLWSIVSYAFVTFIFEFFNPKNNSDEILTSSESSSEDQANGGGNTANSNNMMDVELPSRGLSRLLVPTLFFIFGFFLLIMLIMRSAYYPNYRRKLSINSSSSSSSSQPLSESARGTGATAVGNGSGSGSARANSISNNNNNNNSTSQRHHHDSSVSNNSTADSGSSRGLATSATTTSTASSVSMRKTATTTSHHPPQ